MTVKTGQATSISQRGTSRSMENLPNTQLRQNLRTSRKAEPKTPHLFRPVSFRSITARNRVMMSPMCQYSSDGGLANTWHLAHLGARAVGGAGIVCVEATHVEERGRITHHCMGLWNDAQRDSLAPIAAFIQAQGAVPAIQLAHSGRKGSVQRPWQGSAPLGREEGAWQTIAPSPIPFTEAHGVPAEMSRVDIAEVIEAFAGSARRALEAGFKIVELHAAHGYLGHSFLSPLSNRRRDAYGGSLENRIRFLMETLDAVRRVWPDELPLFVRLTCDDWVEGGFGLDQAVATARLLRARGDVDLIDCSSGGLDPRQQIKAYPGYQVHFSARIRHEVGIATGAVGLLNAPELAEAVLASGCADLALIGRGLLSDPHWVLKAAQTLKAADVAWPPQYDRAKNL